MNLTIKSVGSTAYTKINDKLKSYRWYNNFISNKLNRDDYLKVLLKHAAELRLMGLNDDQIHLSTRFPFSHEEKVDQILEDLCQRKVISSIEYPKQKFEEFFQRVSQDFEHGDYTTYIFPEEARLLYALTYITKPNTIVFLGSYYGYWAIWSLDVLKEFGGKAYLIDIDSKVLMLAKQNMRKFNLDSLVNYINEDAIQFMSREKILHDFLVIDPEGPKLGHDPDLLDKAIYYPMVKAADKHLTDNGIILCHNILLTNPISDEYFNKKISYNYGQFTKLLPYMQNNYNICAWYDTTEGVGIFTGKKA